jgi:hypothetical protein
MGKPLSDKFFAASHVKPDFSELEHLRAIIQRDAGPDTEPMVHAMTEGEVAAAKLFDRLALAH